MYFKKKKKILISSRPKQKEFSNFYEFPGGKVEKNELFLIALQRELLEELHIKIQLNKVIFFKSYCIKRDTQKILLNFFICDKWSGKINPMENQFFKWTTIENLSQENMLFSNKKIINYLNLSRSLMK